MRRLWHALRRHIDGDRIIPQVLIHIDRQGYGVPPGTYQGFELRVWSGTLDMDLWREGEGQSDTFVGLTDFVRLAGGERFFSIPRYILGG